MMTNHNSQTTAARARTTVHLEGGGRTWWAHFEFTPINIEPIILRKKIEDFRQLGAFVSRGHVGLLIPVRFRTGSLKARFEPAKARCEGSLAGCVRPRSLDGDLLLFVQRLR
jgi:hypothetical protein